MELSVLKLRVGEKPPRFQRGGRGQGVVGFVPSLELIYFYFVWCGRRASAERWSRRERDILVLVCRSHIDARGSQSLRAESWKLEKVEETEKALEPSLRLLWPCAGLPLSLVFKIILFGIQCLWNPAQPQVGPQGLRYRTPSYLVGVKHLYDVSGAAYALGRPTQ